jgi:hypothetical protein
VLCCQLLTELSGLFGRKIQSLKKKSCPINNFSLFGVILICTTEENLKFKVLYVCDEIQPQIFQICDICLFLIGTFFELCGRTLCLELATLGLGGVGIFAA